MLQNFLHTFHIPVMGLAFSIDSPLKVARFGISSVLSLCDDALLEDMRRYYSAVFQKPYVPIQKDEEDGRARRATAYLDLVDDVVNEQIERLRQEEFAPGTQLTKYFELLPDNSPLRALYEQMLASTDAPYQQYLQSQLREAVTPGSIDVNIMTKLDKTNYGPDGQPLPAEFTDASAALRGFAKSKVRSSIVFSAGMNMRLYGYMDQFPCFLPNAAGEFEKKVILKVSDYRSAAVQGKILAKKGIWISEFRVESGLNCGGHAFATDGFLMGPILEEFKQNRQALRTELWDMCQAVLTAKGLPAPTQPPVQKLTVQGGLGTVQEHEFLLEYYGADAVGWGTPFLLVPEATTVDAHTLTQLSDATSDDLYLSPISPLGVPFNAMRGTTSEQLTQSRIDKGKPGSPCIKKHLVSNTEFTDEPICTASRKYQRRKLEHLKSQELSLEAYQREEAKVLAKECLCEGLANTATEEYGLNKKGSNPVAICPGPNLAFFSGIFKLQEMVDHIYGRFNALNQTYRPHVFINELNLYVAYWKNKKEEHLENFNQKQQKYLQTFRQNLQEGINYYKELLPTLFSSDELERQVITLNELLEAEDQLQLSLVHA
ncbi:hypothetical protein TH63_11790 [Rufibacter radiotolerans]|uniref:Uncharacterized protein n=1 Tax=Rufibacter radiotolerans TaxID=1379910 RepID=A0A0H4VK41_9BACT|nr:hypothetical protein [Rufibacter radiotolerans]AKQ46160.1 hypothetical protein TH63_11790 [Rufibacter radiotolerans]